MHVNGSKYFLIAILSVAIYNMAYALDFSATTVEGKVFWSKVQYFSPC